MPDGSPASRRVRRLLLAALSGGLAALTTPSTSLVFLLPVALVPLMLAVEGDGVKGAAVSGGLFGVCFWVATVQWIGFTVHHFGGFAWPLAALAVLIAALILAVPLAAMAGLVAAVEPAGPLAAVPVWAAAWVLQEAVRTSFLGGFPWALLAAPLVVPKLFAHLFGCSMNVITDQTDRTGRKNSDGFRMKEVIGLLDSLFELLFTTKDNVLLLHVG